MFNYYKTTQGLEEIQNRSMHLNARQRRVLLLIDTPDFNILSDDVKQRLAPEPVLQQLLEFGFIQSKKASSSTTENSHCIFDSEIILPAESSHIANTSSSSEATITLPVFIPPTACSPSLTSSLNQAQTFMTELLQRYCGLMAKPLIQKIQQAQDPKSLKFCQMQWLTALQESRMPAQDLQQSLQQLNHYLKH